MNTATTLSAILDSLATLHAPPKPARPATPLRWYEYDLEALGWCLHVGYTAEWDRCDEVYVITIRRLLLGTHGADDLELPLTALAGSDLAMIESLIADEEVTAAEAEAQATPPESDADRRAMARDMSACARRGEEWPL